jgi:undecaprenyl-phosphate galactose phosphotransferase
VLKGEISLVGPRTIPPTEAEQDFREQSPLILSVKTGITGLAQVAGRSDLGIKERIRLDQYYVQNWSPWLDFKILVKTIGTVLGRRGAE